VSIVQPILTTQERITDYKTVNVFLSSMLRNCLKSNYTYQYGLAHFQKFLAWKYHHQYNIETILKPLSKNELDVYVVLDEFVSYLVDATLELTSNTIKLYIAAVRSYLAYYDVDIIPSKFKRKVKMPKLYREDEEPLDTPDIRKILLSCNNRRLKTYLLVLASGGMRAVEGLAIRLKDVDFTVNPTKIHIRKEFSKTKAARDIYISDEATQHLKQWIDWKYSNEERPRTRDEDDLLFTVYRTKTRK
jgi:integrase